MSHRHAPGELVGDLPDYAFDPLHIRLGRRAVDLWLRSYLMRLPWLPGQVGAALWNIESAGCDRTLAWSLSNTLRQRAHHADLLVRGLPLERHDELSGWVVCERSVLNVTRKAVWNGALR